MSWATSAAEVVGRMGLPLNAGIQTQSFCSHLGMGAKDLGSWVIDLCSGAVFGRSGRLRFRVRLFGFLGRWFWLFLLLGCRR